MSLGESMRRYAFVVLACEVLTCMVLVSKVHAQANDSLVIDYKNGSHITIAVKDISQMTFEGATVAVSEPTPNSLRLLGVYPNPAQDFVDLRVETPSSSMATFEIVNELGIIIRRLTTTLPAGPSSIRWDLSDTQGKFVGKGVYFLRLLVGGVNFSSKILIMP